MLNFEWDDDKNKSNQAKYNISFEDATDVFNDQDRLQFELEKMENGEIDDWKGILVLRNRCVHDTESGHQDYFCKTSQSR